MLDSLFGIRTINSSSSQSSASHIRSRCSRFTRSASSWYNSLIVFGRIPVARARSACVSLSSPSFFDSKIFIIRHCSFRFNLPYNGNLRRKLLDYIVLCYTNRQFMGGSIEINERFQG